MPYNHQQVEKKWQEKWDKSDVFCAKDNSDKPKYYCLIEFPYPSGTGLHMGHPRSYTAMDVIVRKRRMEGFNVLYPIGWDAFGLPTENHAIKTGRKPQDVTAENIATFKRQLKSLGLSFDWSREINTTDPEYYKWTQWMFLQFFKAGLTYKAKMPINWCLLCKIGLANEEVVDGKCERCGGPTEKREKEQWMIAITKYADRLLEDLKTVDYLEKIKKQQENWIGKSEGVAFDCKVKGLDMRFEVFDSVPQTFMAQTFAVIAPDHPKLTELVIGTENEDEVLKKAREIVKLKMDDKYNKEREVDGIFTGRYLEDPYGTGDLPIWIASFAIADYGSGVVNCSVHDERDFAFAKKFNIPLRPVMFPKNKDEAQKVRNLDYCFHHKDNGILEAPNEFAGRKWGEVREDVIDYLEKKGIGKRSIQYKLRDWIFSRQRYWGEPIPLVKCEKCEQQKTKVLLVHGIYGHSQENWFPWFKKELSAQGYDVIIPDLPNTDNPTLEEWISALEQQNINKNDEVIVIGHSLGAPTACQFIRKNKLKVKKLILVAPTGTEQGEEQWNNLKSAGCDNDGINRIQQFNSANIHLNEVEKLVECTVIYLSDNDPYIPLSVVKNYKQLKPKVITLKSRGHFSELHNEKEFPEILLEFSGCQSWIPVPDNELPVKLPDIEKYEPSETGESPLAAIHDWVNTKCPQCGGPAKRETDTMPNWAGSSWYFLAYIMKGVSASYKLQTTSYQPAFSYWMPVDWYNGGMEHTTLHLLYSRFWNKFLFDQGFSPVSEPYAKRTSHGLVLAEDGTKMSKSKGDVVNPDEMVNEYGADAVRLYELFMGPFSEPVPWSINGLVGMRRFLEKAVEIARRTKEDKGGQKETDEVTKLLHQTIKKVTEDIEHMRFNTAISQMMIFVNTVKDHGSISKESFATFLRLLCPFAPHLANELYEHLGGVEFLEELSWPKYDLELAKEEIITIAIQINGKLRGTIEISVDAEEELVKKLALENEHVKKFLEGKSVDKILYVKNKIVSIVEK